MNHAADRIVFWDSSLEKNFNSMPENDPIKKAMKRAFKGMKEDPFCGRNVKKKLIPKKFLAKYRINNLWIYNLPDGWRLLYSVAGSKIEIIAAVLDWMDHKNYEKLFGF